MGVLVMSENKIELKPCPFCGGTETLSVAHKAFWNMNDDLFYEGFACCKNCEIVLKTHEGYGSGADAENAAIEKWNRRMSA